MHIDGELQLKTGDRVELSDSTIHASGVITEELGPDYVRVEWGDSPVSSTHRHSFEFERMISA